MNDYININKDKSTIYLLRKELNISQEKFGEKLGVGKSAISRMELGTYGVTETMAKIICREFNVNESWLRTGQGEMFNHQSTNVKITTFLGNIVAEDKETFKSRLVEILSELTDKEWDWLEKKVNELATKKSIS